MLFNVIGNAIYFEKIMKKELNEAQNESEEKKALTKFFCDFFGFFTNPLYKKQIEQVIGWLKSAQNLKKPIPLAKSPAVQIPQY